MNTQYNVYVVYQDNPEDGSDSDYDSVRIWGIFSTRELAEDALSTLENEEWFITPWTVDYRVK